MPGCQVIAGSTGMFKKIILSLGLLLFSIWLSATVAHAAMHLPNGCKQDVFLTITGKIGRTTNGAQNAYEMSEREFLALPTSTVTTSTPWTPSRSAAAR
jgi:hypothetical protein